MFAAKIVSAVSKGLKASVAALAKAEAAHVATALQHDLKAAYHSAMSVAAREEAAAAAKLHAAVSKVFD